MDPRCGAPALAHSSSVDLTGWNPQVAQALRTLEHGSPERAGNASAALSWLVGEEGPEALTQASLQEFL